MRKKFTKALIGGIAAASLVACMGLVACGGSSEGGDAAPAADNAQAGQVQIFAANSLEKALPEVQELYTASHPDVTFADSQFKGSDELVTTLQGGAAADILITASTATMDKAAENGSIDEATRADMFVNDLVICYKDGQDIAINDVKDLAGNGIESIAIGDPNLVPAGKYACQTLDAAGLAKYTENEDKTVTVEYGDEIKSKMNDGADKVGTVAKYVADGEAQLGFVYSSDIFRYDGIKVAYTVPGDMHKDIKYPGAVVAGSANAEVAADFLNFCMTDADAQAIFSKYGFELAA